MPKVSVLMSTYNDGAFIARAIESIRAQTYNDWELVVINDNSTDNTEEIVKDFAARESRIVYLRNNENRGLVANLNKAIALAQGEYLARLDSDDFWSDVGKLKKQVEFLENNSQVGLVGTWAQAIDENGTELRVIKYPCADEGIRKQILWHNCFVHSSILAKKPLVEACGKYNKAEKHVEDYGLWLRMGLVTKFANLPEVCVNYRIKQTGITRTKNPQQIRTALSLIKSYKNHYPNYFLGWLKWSIQKLI